MDYISREELHERLSERASRSSHSDFQPAPTWNEAVAIMDSIPAADVRENKRGTWKRVVDFTGVEAFGYKETMIVGYGCNVCGYEVDVSEGDYNYCPNCGADMRSTDCTKTVTADEEREVLNVRAWLNNGADMREDAT